MTATIWREIIEQYKLIIVVVGPQILLYYNYLNHYVYIERYKYNFLCVYDKSIPLSVRLKFSSFGSKIEIEIGIKSSWIIIAINLLIKLLVRFIRLDFN